MKGMGQGQQKEVLISMGAEVIPAISKTIFNEVK